MSVNSVSAQTQLKVGNAVYEDEVSWFRERGSRSERAVAIRTVSFGSHSYDLHAHRGRPVHQHTDAQCFTRLRSVFHVIEHDLGPNWYGHRYRPARRNDHLDGVRDFHGIYSQRGSGRSGQQRQLRRGPGHRVYDRRRDRRERHGLDRRLHRCNGGEHRN